MDSHNATSNATNPATAGKRRREADTLITDDVSNGGVGPSVCCKCGCHKLGNQAIMDSVYLDSLPIGYRFDPTDEELITHYLLKKIKNEDLPRNKIGNADIYGNHPKDIVVNYPQATEGVWYFFTSRNRKYVNGSRPCRKAGFGYWKATGPDHVIKVNGSKIGGRKSLGYHEGHPPKGTKTDWMMQEYVVFGYQRQRFNLQDMKLDDYVLCKIYTNTRSGKEINEQLVINQQPGVASNDQATVSYQQASRVSNQETNPSVIQSGNNIVGVHHFQNSNHEAIHDVENSIPVLKSDHQQHMINPASFHIVNNVDVQLSNYNFPRIRSPLRPAYSLTRFNHNYSMPNPAYFPPPPPPPPHNDCNGGVEFLNNNIEFMITQDVNFLLDDNFFSFDGHEDVDVDITKLPKKH